ncbi:hypothetical protein C4K04_1594 [Pseudomonas chlororaphis]|uniref:Uncharacterized protein n=1 Tax=Pseudomonas chlororaphis TaxID=587753 RepID=A0A3G7TJM8_9PSED|nr:hypothetical protein C4K04_1594 [Pseudomonas chlororaphis]
MLVKHDYKMGSADFHDFGFWNAFSELLNRHGDSIANGVIPILALNFIKNRQVLNRLVRSRLQPF